MLECPDNDVLSAFQADIENRSVRNWPSYQGIYTIGGYNLSYNLEHYDAVNEIMTNNATFSEFAYGNAVNATEWIDRYERGEVNIQQWEEQIKNNAIKRIYLYYDNLDIVYKMIEIINNLDYICVEKTDYTGNGCAVLQLSGVNSLAYGNNRELVNLKSIVNGVEVQGRVDGNLYLGFLYDEKYTAYTIEDGYKRFFPIKADKDGYIIIENVQADRVFLVYRDAWSYMTIVYAILAVIVFSSSVIFNELKVGK